MSLDFAHLGGPYDSVLDVGGNVGDFAKACYMAWPHAQIHSFEPLQDLAEESHTRAQGRWVVHPFAIGARPDRSIIYRSLAQPSASTMREPGPVRLRVFGIKDAYRGEPVTVVPLDDWLEYAIPPCLVKIDVEGYEWDVLQGAPGVLNRATTVVVEVQNDPGIFKGSSSVDELDGILNYHGLRFSGLAGAFLHPSTDAVLQYDGVWRRLER
jgi:FkbM family methyltransferase